MSKKVPKEVKPQAPKKVKKQQVINEEAKTKLISFTITATIPTMMYGNIVPSISVESPSIAEARNFVEPIIEEMYQKYVGEAQDGRAPKFINKANVTATEKKVEVAPAPKIAPGIMQTPSKPSENKTPAENVGALADELNPKSAAYEKAFGAIKNSMGLDALNLIEEQIQKSTKLSAEEKPILSTEVLKKRKEFAL